MQRLTFKEPDGRLGVVGMNKNNEELMLHACVRKLLKYEETELSPDEVLFLKLENEALKKKLIKLQEDEVPRFSHRLRFLRKINNYTQAQLAKCLRVNRMTIVKWEKGTTEPTLSQVRHLCNLFNTNLNYLSGESTNDDK